MNDEFKKLDQFMLRHRPEPVAGKKSLSLPGKSSRWMGYAVACGISGLIAIAVVNDHYQKAESALVLSEVLSWDVTSDEFPVEIDNELAMLDY